MSPTQSSRSRSKKHKIRIYVRPSEAKQIKQLAKSLDLTLAQTIFWALDKTLGK